jgi:hypothetical protein
VGAPDVALMQKNSMTALGDGPVLFTTESAHEQRKKLPVNLG